MSLRSAMLHAREAQELIDLRNSFRPFEPTTDNFRISNETEAILQLNQAAEYIVRAFQEYASPNEEVFYACRRQIHELRIAWHDYEIMFSDYPKMNITQLPEDKKAYFDMLIQEEYRRKQMAANYTTTTGTFYGNTMSTQYMWEPIISSASFSRPVQPSILSDNPEILNKKAKIELEYQKLFKDCVKNYKKMADRFAGFLFEFCFYEKSLLHPEITIVYNNLKHYEFFKTTGLIDPELDSYTDYDFLINDKKIDCKMTLRHKNASLKSPADKYIVNYLFLHNRLTIYKPNTTLNKCQKRDKYYLLSYANADLILSDKEKIFAYLAGSMI